MERFLHQRAIGQRHRFRYSDLSLGVKEELNRSVNKLCTSLDELRDAVSVLRFTPLAIIKENSWSDIERAVYHVSEQLLETQTLPSQHKLTSSKKMERELFISIGGCYELLKLLDYPFSASSSTIFLANILRKHSDIWNAALLTLREVCCSVPCIGETIFNMSHIIFLFNLLVYSSVFENALHLIEEILATRTEVFSLRMVPNLHNILKVLNTRQLAHFCRVLALLLFEPEDRQILEGAQTLKSFDLLQLRRDKLSRPSYTVERNQSLIVEMPCLISRLVTLLKITNFAPNLKELITRHIMVQATLITHEVLYQMLAIDESESDWDYFNGLVDVVDASLAPDAVDFKDAEDEHWHEVLLRAFTPNAVEGNIHSMDMTNILNSELKYILSIF